MRAAAVTLVEVLHEVRARRRVRAHRGRHLDHRV